MKTKYQNGNKQFFKLSNAHLVIGGWVGEWLGELVDGWLTE